MVDAMSQPTFNEMSSMFYALQTVTGANLNGEEGFWNVNGELMHGEDADTPVTDDEFEQASQRCRFAAWYIEKWCLEYCENQRSWADLED
jgi:hypothetical protein